MNTLGVDLERRAGWLQWRDSRRQRPGESGRVDLDSSWCSKKPARFPVAWGHPGVPGEHFTFCMAPGLAARPCS